MPDVAGADSVGGALLGIAVLYGTVILATVLPGSLPAPEQADRPARQLLLIVKRWLPERAIIVVADSTFAALALLGAVRQHVCDHAVASGCGVIRPGTAVWHNKGLPVVPIRWVLVRDPKGQFKSLAFLCIDLNMTPDQILAWFVWRWQVEVTFEETRAHLGMETQRQWAQPAIARTTPTILALYSMVTLLAKLLFEQGMIPILAAVWYSKQGAAFSDTIALVRRYLWRAQTLAMLEKSSDTIEIPRALFQRLADTLSYAA